MNRTVVTRLFSGAALAAVTMFLLVGPVAIAADGDECTGVTCPTGQICHPDTGRCVAFGCDTTACAANTPGSCAVDHPIHGAPCPAGITCIYGCRSNIAKTLCDCW